MEDLGREGGVSWVKVGEDRLLEGFVFKANFEILKII